MFNFLKREKIMPQVLTAYKWRFPEDINVSLKSSQDGGYIAYVNNLPGCITQAGTGQELFEMVNDAVYTYLQIPEAYQPYMPTFLPPENIRKDLSIKIPIKYLNENLVLEKT